jgi:hypothetical protein
MQDILDAIARRADLVATFKRLEAMIPGVSSAELRPVIAASLELAQKLDLKADSKAIEGLNRVWTRYCEKSTADGEFLYDAVLSAIENADWDDAQAGERVYKLVVAFKGRHLDFFGSNKNQRLALRTNLTRLTTLVEYLMNLEDRQLFTIERSMYQGRFGEIVGMLLDVFSQHSSWRGDDDLRAAASALIFPSVTKFPYVGNILTVKLLQANPDCDWLVAEIVNAHVVAGQSGGMLRELAGELMRGSTSEDFSKRIPGVMGHLAPLAAKWTAANTDLFVEQFFEKAFFSDKDRATALEKSNEKRSLAEMVLALGHDTSKVQQLASWMSPPAAPAEPSPSPSPSPEPSSSPAPSSSPESPAPEPPMPEPPPAEAESKPGAQKKGGAKRAAKRKTKKAGAVFADFNFKLLVIEALMYQRKVLKPKFDVRAFAKDHVDREIDVEKEGHAVIPEAKQYFQDLALTKTQLGKVTRLAIDGGAQVYLQIIPRWDGEDDTFDITSVDDAALLPKLKVFDFGDSTELRKKLGPALKGRGIKVLPG